MEGKGYKADLEAASKVTLSATTALKKLAKAQHGEKDPAVPIRHYIGRMGYHMYGWSARQCRMLLGYTKLVKHQMGIL